MPALTISAVDNTTDRITCTAHGQLTGAGPAAIFAQPGGVIPTGLTGGVDMWLIVVDANTLKLATSSANALAGTAIDITSNGTLPLSLLLGLPYRRPRTAAPGTQVFSADNNATWDSLVAIWNMITGQAQSVFTGITLAANQHVTLSGAGKYKRGPLVRKIPISSGSFSAANGYSPFTWTALANGNVFTFPLVVTEGETLTQVKCKVSCGATDVIRLRVYRYDPATQTSTQLGGSVSSAGHAAATEDLTVSGLTEVCSSADAFNYSAELDVTAFATSPRTHGCEQTTIVA